MRQSVSDEAREVRRSRLRIEDSSISSNLQGSMTKILNELEAAFFEASNADWDGYQAHGADPATLSYALNFVSLLPSYFPLPEIAIDKDGEIAFDWDFEPRRIMSLRIGRDGTLNYAGLIGHSSFHGSEILRDNIPLAIDNGIKRIVDNSPQLKFSLKKLLFVIS